MKLKKYSFHTASIFVSFDHVIFNLYDDFLDEDDCFNVALCAFRQVHIVVLCSLVVCCLVVVG